MKLVLLGKWSESAVGGGPIIHTLNIVKCLSNNYEFDSFLISFGSKSVTFYHGKVKIIIIKINPIYFYLPFFAIIKIGLEIRKIKPDIIHVLGNNLSPYLLYVLFSANKSKKIVTIHSTMTQELIALKKIKKGSIKHMLFKLLEKLSILKFNYLICVTNKIKIWYKLEYGECYENKLINIRNGVNINEFNPNKIDNIKLNNIRIKYNLSDKTPIIFHAKSFDIINGQEYLIRSMEKIVSDFPNASLILAGDGVLKNSLQKYVNENKLSKNVFFLGVIAHDEIPYFLFICDMVVLPSIILDEKEEGSSLFLLEAMAMERPVIATDVGGLKEDIINYENGLLVPEKNPNEIANAVNILIKNNLLRKTLVSNAKKNILSERTWEKMIQKTIIIYKKNKLIYHY